MQLDAVDRGEECAGRPVSSAQERAPAGHPAMTLVATGLGLFMVLMDATITNVALPSIQSDFGVGESGLQWVAAACSVTMAMFMMTSASLSDAHGRKRASLTGFASVGLAIGPTLGGLLTDSVGWRWIFLVHLFVGAATIVLTVAFVSESSSSAHHSFDPVGQILFIGGIGGLTHALVQAPRRRAGRTCNLRADDHGDGGAGRVRHIRAPEQRSDDGASAVSQPALHRCHPDGVRRALLRIRSAPGHHPVLPEHRPVQRG